MDDGTSHLPPPRRTNSPYIVTFVCLGNICRSPMAAVVLTGKMRQKGLAGLIEVRSCGTGDWHVGEEMDSRAAAVLTAAGYDPSRHRAAHFDRSWLEVSDVLMAMDRSNLENICAVAGSEESRSRVLMFRCFDSKAAGAEDLDLSDPWYGGPAEFRAVLDTIERTTDSLAGSLRHLLT